jgi:hypothetical protein
VTPPEIANVSVPQAVRPPADVALEQELQQRLEQSMHELEHAEQAVREHQRVVSSCRAGLRELAERVPDQSEYAESPTAPRGDR